MCQINDYYYYLTSPSLHHVDDDVVDEADLRARDGAGGAVEHGHHHGQVLRLLLVRLQEVFLGNPDRIHGLTLDNSSICQESKRLCKSMFKNVDAG